MEHTAAAAAVMDVGSVGAALAVPLMHHHAFGANYKSTNIMIHDMSRANTEISQKFTTFFSRQCRTNRCSRVPTDFRSMQRHYYHGMHIYHRACSVCAVMDGLRGAWLIPGDDAGAELISH